MVFSREIDTSFATNLPPAVYVEINDANCSFSNTRCSCFVLILRAVESLEMTRTIKLKSVLPYPPEMVWRALTDPALLGEWFMKNDIEPTLHHSFTFRMAPQKGWDGITHCEILAVNPPNSISYTYRGEASGEKALACAGIHSDTADKMTKGIFARLDTVLSFKLETTCGGTILYMEHAGYAGLKLVLISLIMQMGWKKQLRKKMPAVLRRMSVAE
jgi:uncharacterized protein YndB with AHSA1/START domain